MTKRILGYFVIAAVIAVSASIYLYIDQKREATRIANLQPEISPPPPDQMWAIKTPAPQVGRRRGMQMSERPNLSPSPSPSISPTSDSTRIEPLLRDREQLLKQIWQLTPTQINEQLTLRNEELQQLHAQLAQYQNAEQNLNQQLTETLQFRAVVRQGMLTELDDRIRIQERLIQSTRDQISTVTLNPAMYNPGFAQALQAQQTVLEQQFQGMLSQRSTISGDAMAEMERLNLQTLTNRSVLATARMAVQSQIRFLEQDLTRLTQVKANIELLQQQYRREADQVELQLKNLGADQRKLKELKFP